MTATLACERPSRKHPDGRTGTRAGYMAHYYAKEAACEACRNGHATETATERAADPEKSLQGNLRYKYRLSLDDYQEKLRAQGGKCAICGVDAPTDVRTSRFHVDHDHRCCSGYPTCGKCTRGLLCHACNTALGNLRDDPDVLLAAMSYILSYAEADRG